MNRALRIVLLLAAFATPMVAPAQSPPTYDYDQEDRRAADSAATEALATFALLVDQWSSQDLGFAGPDEVREATLGEPFPELMIRLDRLREYQEGQEAAELLTPTGRWTYPVLVGGETRSSLTVSRGDEGWAARSYGAPTYSRMLSETREQVRRTGDRPVTEYFEVRVPALNLAFIGHMGDRGLELTPILDDARFGFTRGETLPATEILSALVEAAREHNGLPT